MRHPLPAAALAAALLIATPYAGWAEPAPKFDELLRRVGDSPRVEVLAADVAKAEGLARQARARPNPTISLYGENFAGTSPYDGTLRAEATLQFSQPLEVGGKRLARIAAANAGVAAARARGLEGRIAYADELARAYAAVEIAERRIGIAEDEVEEAEADLKLARALVGAGKEARLRELQAATEVETMQAELEGARAVEVAALARLSALAGVQQPYTSLSESLLDRPASHPVAVMADASSNAAYVAAKAEQDAAAKRVIAERKRAIPDITGQIGVRRLYQDNATALVAGVSVPLNLFDRNRGNIAAAEAERRGAAARAAVARLEAEAGLRTAVAQVEAAEARAAAAERTMATAQEAYRLARIAYEAGKSPLSELLAARRRLGIVRGVVVDAAVARFEARAHLARLQGTTITGEPVQ